MNRADDDNELLGFIDKPDAAFFCVVVALGFAFLVFAYVCLLLLVRG